MEIEVNGLTFTLRKRDGACGLLQTQFQISEDAEPISLLTTSNIVLGQGLHNDGARASRRQRGRETWALEVSDVLRLSRGGMAARRDARQPSPVQAPVEAGARHRGRQARGRFGGG